MDIWLIVLIAFGFGALGGLTKLTDGKRDLSTRAFCGGLLSGGLAGLIIGLSTAGTFYAGYEAYATYAKLEHKAREINTHALLFSVIVSSSAAGYRGAKAAVDRVQIRKCKSQDGDQENGSETS
jgi:L-asparagine transporter-like permease